MHKKRTRNKFINSILQRKCGGILLNMRFCPNTTIYEYDSLNRRVAMIDALTHRTSYLYDNADRLVKTTFADGSFTTTDYDEAGQKVAETDGENNQTKFEYNPVGNLVTVTDPLLNASRTVYDSLGRKIAQVNANRDTTSFVYDEKGRMVELRYPAVDGVVNSEKYVYDALDNVIEKVVGSDTVRYTFNKMNRETERKYSNSGHIVQTEYTASGKAKSDFSHLGLTEYEYGPCCSQLMKVKNPDGTFIEYEYDANKDIIGILTPFDTTRYQFDPLKRMKKVINGTDTTTYYYNAVGNRDSVSFGNGTSTGYQFDILNRLTKVTNYGKNHSVLSSFAYELNRAGIRTSVTEYEGSKVAYGYDKLNRLVSETRTGSHPYSIVYSYDAVGNRLTQTRDGVETVYSYNNRDQIVAEITGTDTVSYRYDLSGRLAEKREGGKTTSYRWDDGDRLDQVATDSLTTTYAYNGRGIKVKENGTNLLVDEYRDYPQVIGEYSSTDTVNYTFGLERIAQDNGMVHWYLADGQESIRQLTDSVGEVTDSYGYTAFGEELYRTGTTKNKFQYVGESFDPNSGFYYLRARWMTPEAGLFISVDPGNGYIGEPISLHRYLYANPSPISFFDPSGFYTTAELNTSVNIRNELAGREMIIIKSTRKQGNKFFAKIICSGAKMLANHEAPVHQMATNKNYKAGDKFSKTFDDDFFGPAGLDLNHWANRVAIPGHKGPHSKEYPDFVIDFLKTRIDPKKLVKEVGVDIAQDMLIDALLDLAVELCDPSSKGSKLLMNVL